MFLRQPVMDQDMNPSLRPIVESRYEPKSKDPVMDQDTNQVMFSSIFLHLEKLREVWRVCHAIFGVIPVMDQDMSQVQDPVMDQDKNQVKRPSNGSRYKPKSLTKRRIKI
jgi:hypothetical protein